MAFLSLKSESAKTSFYNMKIRVEKVIFICCPLRHPKLHKYPTRCGSQCKSAAPKLGKMFEKWVWAAVCAAGNQHWFVGVLGVSLGSVPVQRGPQRWVGWREGCAWGLGTSWGSRSVPNPDGSGAARVQR